jgi:hypothetical protein
MMRATTERRSARGEDMLKHNTDTVVESWDEDDENQSRHWRVRILGSNGAPDVLINCSLESDADYIEHALNTFGKSVSFERPTIGAF